MFTYCAQHTHAQSTLDGPRVCPAEGTPATRPKAHIYYTALLNRTAVNMLLRPSMKHENIKTNNITACARARDCTSVSQTLRHRHIVARDCRTQPHAQYLLYAFAKDRKKNARMRTALENDQNQHRRRATTHTDRTTEKIRQHKIQVSYARLRSRVG